MNKFFAILIICSLSLPVLAIDGQEADFEQFGREDTPETVVQDRINLPEDSVYETDTDLFQETPQTLVKYKEPAGKNKLIKKFLIAMICVAGASVLLYGILSLYNKIRDNILPQPPTPPEGEKPLDIPSDLYEAVKTFIDKTRWYG